MDKKLALVTGASSGIGLETARGLAREGCRVVMACRNLKKAIPLAKGIIEECGEGAVEVMALELGSFQAICDFADTFKSKYRRLDILINNAGVFTDRRQTTADGFELTIGVNYLAHYLLTRLLLPQLLAAPAARIINVTSRAGLYGKLQVDENFFKGNAVGFKAYAASKMAQMLFTIELAEELGSAGVKVNAAYPGRVATNIWQGGGLLTRMIGRMMMRKSVSAEVGAKTGIYLALSPSVAETSGKLFFEEDIFEYSKTCRDENLRRNLIKASDLAIESAGCITTKTIKN